MEDIFKLHEFLSEVTSLLQGLCHILFDSMGTNAPYLSILGVLGLVINHLSRCPLEVSALMPDLHCSVYSMALNNLSICLAIKCWIFVLNFLLRAVGIVTAFIHLPLSVLFVTRPSKFSFFALNLLSCIDNVESLFCFLDCMSSRS